MGVVIPSGRTDRIRPPRNDAEPGRSVATLTGVAALLTFVLWDWFFRPVGGGRDAVGYLLGRDFLPVWAAPRLAMERGAAVLGDIPAFAAALPDLVGVRGVFAVWNYPPTALLLFMPFSLPSYWASLALWTAAGWVAYLLSGVALRGERPRAPALLLLAASPAMWLSTETGQNGAFTGALLIGGLAALEKRPILSGVLFGLMTFKPHIGLALAVCLLAIRAWRAVAAAVATAALLACAATSVFGVGAWLDYEAISMPYCARILAASSGGQKLLLVSLTSGLTQAGVALPAALIAQALVAALVLATLCVAARRTGDPLRLLALVAAATPLVSPYVWAYDLVPLGAALGLRFIDDPGPCPRWVFAVGFLSPALSMAFEVMAGVATAPAFLALVFAGLSWEALRVPVLRDAHGLTA